MPSQEIRPILAYRAAEDSRQDAREEQGSLAGRVAIWTIWAFFAGAVVLFLSSIVLWGLILSAAW